jgi:hypothetical protein
MPKYDLHINLVSFLLLFLFGGAIVGETASLSMAVTVAGPAVLGKLFLVNGLLLFLLPPLFFSNIDRLNRGKLLSAQLLIVASILTCYIAVFSLVGRADLKTLSLLVLIVYPVSYLSKTTLFLSFWTLANDIYSTDESKKGFPRIAAWGFCGGLAGACGARLLLEVVDAQMILGLWASGYFVAYFFAKRITMKYKEQLLRKEYVEEAWTKMPLLPAVRTVLSIKLVRLISLLYFLVFIAIFLQDYLFWRKSAAFFPTSNSLASFQYTYYVAYSFVTIAGLYFFMPGIIAKMGFTRVFSLLPLTLLVGSAAMLCVESAHVAVGNRIVFGCFLVFQFARYVVFENAFSPVYQMFFTAIRKEKRGRAKTFLEGMVKPTAIIISGIALILLPTITQGILVVIFCLSIIMVFTVRSIRTSYTDELVSRFMLRDAGDAPDGLMSKIGGAGGADIVSLVKEHSLSAESDVRRLAARILSHAGSRQAFDILSSMYGSETDSRVREAVAAGLFNFPFDETRELVGRMLRDDNPRVRANALHSLNRMDVAWKGDFFDDIKAMFFEISPRVQIEAAAYLWATGESSQRDNVVSFLKYLLEVKNANRRAAGLYLTGMLRPAGWETTLLVNLRASSAQVFTKCVEIIFSSATASTQRAALALIETMPRRYITLTGRVLRNQGAKAFATIVDFMREIVNRRMMVELVLCARRIAEDNSAAVRSFPRDPEIDAIITDWIMGELEGVYRDCYAWSAFCGRTDCKRSSDDRLAFLERALSDQCARVCDLSLDALSLLDEKGVMATVRRDLDLREKTNRSEMIEIVDAFSPPRIAGLVIPILRSDPLDSLARTGKAYFHFNEGLAQEELGYFVLSKNHWISLSALYSLWRGSASGWSNAQALVERYREALVRVSREKHSPLAIIAERLLGIKEQSMEPFDLLERVMSLKKTQLFRNVPAEKLIELAEISQHLSYKEGTLISREGELSDHLYVVASGSLKIVKMRGTVKTILSIIEKGETYGEIGLFNQAPRSASAVANEDCELWVVQRSALKKLLLDMPDIAYNLLEVFSEKLRRSGEEVAMLTSTLSTHKKELTLLDD